MHKTVQATYDGKFLLPDEPIEIKPNTRVLITIETYTEAPKKKRSFIQTAKSLNIDGPDDWSARFEDYLYGNKDTNE